MKFYTKTLHLETQTRPPLLYPLRKITVQAAVALGMQCPFSQAGIVGRCFLTKNNKCIMERIISRTMYRKTYLIVTKAYLFTHSHVEFSEKRVVDCCLLDRHNYVGIMLGRRPIVVFLLDLPTRTKQHLLLQYIEPAVPALHGLLHRTKYLYKLLFSNG